MSVETQTRNGELVLETERLRLRRFRHEDVDAVFARQWVDRNLRRYAEHGHGLFAVMLKGSDEVIGDCGVILQVVEGEKHLEVGYHFRRDHWGQGYATEAARACTGLAFQSFGAEKVISLIRPENVPSRRVAERTGMKPERQVIHYNLPHLVYAMKREEFDFDRP